MSTLSRLQNLCIPSEPAVPVRVLGEPELERFRSAPSGGTVAIKVSSAYDLPYPFCVSPGFVGRVVEEILTANRSLNVLLLEGGVRERSVLEVAEKVGLTSVRNATFVDAEDDETVFV